MQIKLCYPNLLYFASTPGLYFRKTPYIAARVKYSGKQSAPPHGFIVPACPSPVHLAHAITPSSVSADEGVAILRI